MKTLHTAVAALLGLGIVFSAPVAARAAGTVLVATISGSINPASADYLIHAIELAEEEEAAA